MNFGEAPGLLFEFERGGLALLVDLVNELLRDGRVCVYIQRLSGPCCPHLPIVPQTKPHGRKERARHDGVR